MNKNNPSAASSAQKKIQEQISGNRFTERSQIDHKRSTSHQYIHIGPLKNSLEVPSPKNKKNIDDAGSLIKQPISSYSSLKLPLKNKKSLFSSTKKLQAEKIARITKILEEISSSKSHIPRKSTATPSDYKRLSKKSIHTPSTKTPSIRSSSNQNVHIPNPKTPSSITSEKSKTKTTVNLIKSSVSQKTITGDKFLSMAARPKLTSGSIWGHHILQSSSSPNTSKDSLDRAGFLRELREQLLPLLNTEQEELRVIRKKFLQQKAKNPLPHRILNAALATGKNTLSTLTTTKISPSKSRRSSTTNNNPLINKICEEIQDTTKSIKIKDQDSLTIPASKFRLRGKSKEEYSERELSFDQKKNEKEKEKTREQKPSHIRRMSDSNISIKAKDVASGVLEGISTFVSKLKIRKDENHTRRPSQLNILESIIDEQGEITSTHIDNILTNYNEVIPIPSEEELTRHINTLPLLNLLSEEISSDEGEYAFRDELLLCFPILCKPQYFLLIVLIRLLAPPSKEKIDEFEFVCAKLHMLALIKLWLKEYYQDFSQEMIDHLTSTLNSFPPKEWGDFFVAKGNVNPLPITAHKVLSFLKKQFKSEPENEDSIPIYFYGLYHCRLIRQTTRQILNKPWDCACHFHCTESNERCQSCKLQRPLLQQVTNECRFNFLYTDLDVDISLISASNLAKALMEISYQRFSDIQPRDLIKKGYLKYPQRHQMQLSDHTSLWVATHVLASQSMEGVRDSIKKFIKVAYICFKASDFNTSFEIMTGLGVPAVWRLLSKYKKFTFDVEKKLDKLEKLVNDKMNFREYRQIFQQANTPRIPIFAIVLRDVTTLEETLSSRIEGRINTSKFHSIYNSIYIPLSDQILIQNAVGSICPDNDLLHSVKMSMILVHEEDKLNRLSQNILD